jgi:hypothetical protein
MPVWLSKLLNDWRILASDRGSLALGVIIAIGIGVGALYWSYVSLVTWSSSILEDTTTEINELHARYQTLKNPPRDQSGLYRNGTRIGGVMKPAIDLSNQTVAFQKVSINGELDRTTPFEFQDLILTYKSCDTSDGIRKGDIASFTYYNARFLIVGKRVDQDSRPLRQDQPQAQQQTQPPAQKQAQ